MATHRRLNGLGLAALLTAGLMIAAAPVCAQMSGMPVWNNAGLGTGVIVSGDAGFPPDGGTVFALRAEAGLGLLRLEASLGEQNQGGREDRGATAGAAALRIFGGGLNPVSLNTQAGYADGVDAISAYTRYTASLGLGLKPLIPGLSLAPWISPGLRITHRSGAASGTDTRPGVAGGLSATFGLLGAHIGIDREAGETTVGAGVHLGLGLPVP